MRHQVAFRDRRKGEVGLGGPREAGRAWAGPPAASVAPKKSSWGGGAAEQEESLFPGNDAVQRVCGSHMQVSRGEDCGRALIDAHTHGGWGEWSGQEPLSRRCAAA